MVGRSSESSIEIPLRRREDQDDGCEIHDSCLSCPLLFCKFDVRLDWQLARIRSANIIRLYFDHAYSLEEINEITPDVSRRIAWNVIQAERKRRRNGWGGRDIHAKYRVRVRRVKR